MSTHWKALCNPDYIGAYAFEPGEEKIGTIAYVREESVCGADGKKEDCTVAHFSEAALKPMILNVTNCKAITKLYGTPYIEEWAGKRIVMKVQKVKAFGEVVEAVRIKPEIPQAKKQTKAILCGDCAKPITAYGKMDADALAGYTKAKYGRPLCAACAATASKTDTDKEETEETENAAD